LTIVGFNFTKINAEKTAEVKGKIDIKNQVKITDVEPADLSLGKDKQKGVRYTFSYSSTYEPKIAKIEIAGTLLYLSDDKEVKAIVEQWKKEKKSPEKVMGQVLNTVLTKSNIQALIASKDLSLPPMVPMPKVQVKA